MRVLQGGTRSSPMTLVIGSKNFSSWSMRPWLALKQCEVPFDEVVVPLYHPDTDERIRPHSPSGFVPVLKDGPLTVWDSMAICEYIAERFPEAGLWPSEVEARAVARSVSAEMHSGFAEMRRCLNMNCKAVFPGFKVPDEAARDVARVKAIWGNCRRRYGSGGDFLFGAFSIADAMYAPVVSRFQTYDVKLEGAAADYAAAVRGLADLREWVAAAQLEPDPPKS
jgi:glutathione S-transferase